MKKGGFLRNVLDTIRSNQANQQSTGGSGGGSSGGSGNSLGGCRSDYGGLLKPHHFSLTQVARHGFPETPTALAFDPVQKIAAIGTKTGALRVFGRPGVDVWVQHKPEVAVTHIKFIINQGAIITVTADESINLWSLRGPELKLTFSGTNLSGAHSPTPATSQHHSASAAVSAQLPTPAELADSSDYLSSGVDQLDANMTAISSASSSGPAGATEIQSRVPTILHTLKFQREHITCLHQTLMSKWLYIGTERGNVHVANVETFELSGYSIPWNKAIELSRKTHPGSIIGISECPQDTNKLLIGYETGCIVLWDLKNRNAEGRYYHTEGLLWLAWHYEGKQFMAAHADGSLVTWQTRSNARPLNILHPHAKTSQQQRAAAAAVAAASSSASSGFEQQTGIEQFVSSGHQQVPLAASATSFARALNNELYRPINKVEWKTSKANNEQFLLFSGGLPYDNLDTEATEPLRLSLGSSSPTRMTSSGAQQTKQYLTADGSSSTISPSFCSPLSPSLSPTNSSHPLQAAKSPTHQSTSAPLTSATPAQSRDRRNLRATSLTVMFGKSITVLEMDEAIVDFVTVCDSSPYENDASDPYAVLVLLSNDLILIDLTSPGYPSFESPYPASALNESPVTTIQYLADCSSDIIPMLYSSSTNVISRAPKKGFSDKEWPINGGEWGQQMQSYPELVITGHADGTIKFWDMSGVNFDLISKIKTSKLFERPIKSPNHVIVANHSYRQYQQQQSVNKRRSHNTIRPVSPLTPAQQQALHESERSENDLISPLADVAQLSPIELEDCFAIEKIEYCSESRNLLVAGALSQVIQFKLNKRDSSSPSGGGGSGVGVGPHHELTSILVEPCPAPNSASINEQANQSQHHHTNLLLKPRSTQQAGAAGSTSSAPGGSSSSASGATLSASGRTNRTSGAGPHPWTAFQPDLICLTPLILMRSTASELEKSSAAAAALSAGGGGTEQSQSPTDVYIAPPKVTALALKPSHSILAYSHENGLVLIDIIQKCVVMNASLAELYGCGGPLSNRCDISIQPFATSSILQQHYQSTTGTTSPLSSSTYTLNSGGPSNNPLALEGELARRPLSSHSNNNDVHPVNGGMATQQQQHHKSVISGATDAELHDNGPSGDGSIRAGSLHKSSGKSNGGSSGGVVGQPNTSSSIKLVAEETIKETVCQLGGGSGHALSEAWALEPEQPLPMNQEQRRLSGAQYDEVVDRKPVAAAAEAEMSTGERRSKPETGAKLMHASSLDVADSSQQPIAPPRAKKRQSVPTVRRKHEPLDVAVECEPVVGDGSNPTAGGCHEPSGRRPSTSATAAAAATTTSHQEIDDSSRAVATGASSPTNCSPNENPNPNQNPNLNPSVVVESQSTSTLSSFLSRLMDKIDSSFTRSRSSSASSTAATNSQQQQQQHSTGLDQGPQLAERLNCLCFLDLAPPTGTTSSSTSTSHKSLGSIDNAGQLLALWLGTSTGSVLMVGLQMPDTDDNRVLQLQSVLAEPIPQAALKLRGACLALASFTAEAHRLTPSGGSQSSSLEGDSREPGTGSSSSVDQPPAKAQTFLALVSEKEVRVHQVPASAASPPPPPPSTKTPATGKAPPAGAHEQQLATLQANTSAQWQHWPLVHLLKGKPVSSGQHSDSSFACRSELVWWRQPEEACLASYLATGELRVLSLPQLRVLLEEHLVAFSDARIAESMRFSRNGHALYQTPAGSQVCKFSLSAHYGALLNEMTGSLWVGREMPEQPRANFFKSLFSAAAPSKQAGRDELFGAQAAGKPLRGVATHISGGLDKLKGTLSSGLQGEFRQAREGLDERGDRLSELEDRTAQMANQAEGYAQAAHQLAQRFKDKKWYQF